MATYTVVLIPDPGSVQQPKPPATPAPPEPPKTRRDLPKAPDPG